VNFKLFLSKITGLSIACLYDQTKVAFLDGRLFPANQSFLKTFQIIFEYFLECKNKSRPSKKATFLLIM